MTNHHAPDAHQSDPDLIFDDENTAKEKTVEPLHVISHIEYAELLAKLNETEAAVEDYKNQLLRNQAELENIRKRAEKDVHNAHKYGAEKLISALLPVIDSLERALDLEIGDNTLAKQMNEGMEMTLKCFLAALEKVSVTPLNPLGELFDPNLHQAVSAQADPNTASDTVIKVLQKGYLLNDRLVRPALVIVAS